MSLELGYYDVEGLIVLVMYFVVMNGSIVKGCLIILIREYGFFVILVLEMCFIIIDKVCS